MDQLERRVEKLVSENNNFRQKVKTLSDENSNLLKELQQLLFTSFPKNQSLVISRNAKRLLRADLEEKIDSTLEWIYIVFEKFVSFFTKLSPCTRSSTLIRLIFKLTWLILI